MKAILLIVIAFFTFASSGLFAHFYNRTDDLSLHYILWKKGLGSYPSNIIGHAVISDRDRDELVRGKTKEEIRQIFPDVHHESINENQKMYDKDLIGRDYFRLGKSNVIIFFKDGLGYEISTLKG